MMNWCCNSFQKDLLYLRCLFLWQVKRLFYFVLQLIMSTYRKKDYSNQTTVKSIKVHFKKSFLKWFQTLQINLTVKQIELWCGKIRTHNHPSLNINRNKNQIFLYTILMQSRGSAWFRYRPFLLRQNILFLYVMNLTF